MIILVEKVLENIIAAIVSGIFVIIMLWLSNKNSKKIEGNKAKIKKVKNEIIQYVNPLFEQIDYLKKENIKLKKEKKELKEAVEKDIAEKNKPIHLEF